MTKLAPGVWDDADGTMHIDIDACLEGNGYAVTEQSRRALMKAWLDLGDQAGIEVVIED